MVGIGRGDLDMFVMSSLVLSAKAIDKTAAKAKPKPKPASRTKKTPTTSPTKTSAATKALNQSVAKTHHAIDA